MACSPLEDVGYRISSLNWVRGMELKFTTPLILLGVQNMVGHSAGIEPRKSNAMTSYLGGLLGSYLGRQSHACSCFFKVVRGKVDLFSSSSGLYYLKPKIWVSLTRLPEFLVRRCWILFVYSLWVSWSTWELCWDDSSNGLQRPSLSNQYIVTLWFDPTVFHLHRLSEWYILRFPLNWISDIRWLCQAITCLNSRWLDQRDVGSSSQHWLCP